MLARFLTALTLRQALHLDAAATGAMGALLLAAAPPLAGVLGVGAPLLRGAGLVLLPFAAVLAWAGRRRRVPRRVVGALVAGNVLWAVESVLLVAGGWLTPTTLGAAFVVAQGVVVALFAAAEWAGLRRTPGGAAA